MWFYRIINSFLGIRKKDELKKDLNNISLFKNLMESYKQNTEQTPEQTSEQTPEQSLSLIHI